MFTLYLHFLECLLAFFLLIFLSPLFVILYILVKLTSKGPFLFKQLRAGKNKKPFWIYKIRTMVKDAENLKEKIKHLNQANGPVFKIYDDPRLTKIGQFLTKIGIDELPQLINIVKGQMSFVGPRPLPLDEAKKIPKKYEKRFSVLPGIFSSWVAYSAFHNNFKKWMELDLKDVENKSFWYDLKIVIRSVGFVLKLVLKLKIKNL
jgi:lipopolysaccharide/colanic/teichoic acid biosynthesis glycosyltransferase